MTIRIVKRESLAAGLQRIAGELSASAVADLSNPLLAPDLKVHRFRKHTKALRALLRLHSSPLGPVFKSEERRVRDAARLLGPARDAWVMAHTLAMLDGSRFQPPPFRRADERALERASRRMQAIHDDISSWPLKASGYYDIAPGFARTYGRCREAWSHSIARPSDHQFHIFRRWAKYHLYQLRMLVLCNRRRLTASERQIDQLGDLLGTAHDLAVLQERLSAGQGAGDKRLAAAEQLKQALYRRAVSLGRSCLRPTPDELNARMSRWWVNWRQG